MPTLTAPSEYRTRGDATASGLYLLEDLLNPANSRCFRNPTVVLTARGRSVTATLDNGVTHHYDLDPFALVQRFLKSNPFHTAVGYWGYDLCHHVERLPQSTVDDLHLPDMHVALFEGPIPDRVGEGRLREQPGTTLVEPVRDGQSQSK